MKKHIILFAAMSLVVAAAISCSKESAEPSNVKTMTPCTIQASTGEVSKTHISEIEGTTANVVWDAGDNISVFSTNVAGAGNNQFTISNIDGGSASFSGEVEDGTTSLVAVYPYSEGLSYSGGTISGAAIPTIQTATAGSFVNGASIAAAKGTKTVGDPAVSDLTFSNLCAVIGFTLPEDITFASQVVVTANSGANIAGSVSINAETPAISSPSAPGVIVNGSFTGGETYYICIAPGTYTNGFNFTLTTNGGSTYTRNTTQTVNAEAGKIYTLGKLSLILSSSDFTSSVSLTNTISGGELTGTDAKLTITPKTEIADIIKSYKYSVTFYNGSSVEYRSLTDCTADPTKAVTLGVISGKPYIPQGTYNYTVNLYYTINNGSKDIERGPINLSGTATQAAPSGLPITANLTGYTSYSCYKGTDGQTASASNANGMDNATIKNVGATYKGGVSSAVLTQMGAVTIKSTLDSSEKSGDQGSQSWAAHTIGANWYFDGGSGATNEKTVYVTGLPWQATPPTSKDSNTGWDFSGNYSTTSSSYLELGGNHGTGEPTAKSNFSYFIPSGNTINVKVRAHIHTRTAHLAVWYTTTFEFYAPSGTRIISYGSGKVEGDQDRGYQEGTGTLSNGNSSLKMNGTYAARMANTYIRVYDLQVLYN